MPQQDTSTIQRRAPSAPLWAFVELAKLDDYRSIVEHYVYRSDHPAFEMTWLMLFVKSRRIVIERFAEATLNRLATRPCPADLKNRRKGLIGRARLVLEAAVKARALIEQRPARLQDGVPTQAFRKGLLKLLELDVGERAVAAAYRAHEKRIPVAGYGYRQAPKLGPIPMGELPPPDRSQIRGLVLLNETAYAKVKSLRRKPRVRKPKARVVPAVPPSPSRFVFPVDRYVILPNASPLHVDDGVPAERAALPRVPALV